MQTQMGGAVPKSASAVILPCPKPYRIVYIIGDPKCLGPGWCAEICTGVTRTTFERWKSYTLLESLFTIMTSSEIWSASMTDSLSRHYSCSSPAASILPAACQALRRRPYPMHMMHVPSSDSLIRRGNGNGHLGSIMQCSSIGSQR